MTDKLLPELNPELPTRHAWFRKRIEDCLYVLKYLNQNEEWEKYMIKISELSDELKWAVDNWNQCYKHEFIKNDEIYRKSLMEINNDQ